MKPRIRKQRDILRERRRNPKAIYAPRMENGKYMRCYMLAPWVSHFYTDMLRGLATLEDLPFLPGSIDVDFSTFDRP